MPRTPEEMEADLEELQEEMALLKRLLRKGRAFTNNPLALSTDLDDLGSVKTYLEFDEVADPGAPQAEQGRLWAKSSAADAWPYWTNESGEDSPAVMWHPDNVGEPRSVFRGLQSTTILSGTRGINVLVTHNAGWSSVGVVHATINSSTAAAAERPIGVLTWGVGVNSFNISLTTLINVAANRGFTVAWYADGIL